MKVRAAGSIGWAAAAVLVSLGCIVIAPSPAVAGKPAAAAAPTCGGEQPTTVTGTPWTCTFDEEFDGTSLDRSTWTVQTTASYGSHAPDDCLVDDPQNVSVGGGTLNLTTVRSPAPFACAVPNGSVAAQYTSGSVYMHTFSQLYGRFEVRAKFPDGGGQPGLQGALWLYPRYTSTSKASGPTEIDIAEAYSLYPNLVMPTVHTHSGGTHNCLVTNYAGDFHTYAAVWTPTSVTFFYDGVQCFRVAPNLLGIPLNGARSANAFFVALTQGLGIGRDGPTANTVAPATLQVDYVRVWK